MQYCAAADLETPAIERSKWRSLCKTSIQQFESDCIRALEAKREQRKTATIRSAACYQCQSVDKHVRRELGCSAPLDPHSHSRTHQHWLRSRIRRSTTQSNNNNTGVKDWINQDYGIGGPGLSMSQIDLCVRWPLTVPSATDGAQGNLCSVGFCCAYATVTHTRVRRLHSQYASEQ